MLINPQKVVDVRDAKGMTPLHSAAVRGHKDVVALLLDKGADIAATGNWGKTALRLAAERGHKDVVALLLDKGANITATEITGATALHFAAESGHKDVVALLLDKGADITVTDNGGGGQRYIWQRQKGTRMWLHYSWTRGLTSLRQATRERQH